MFKHILVAVDDSESGQAAYDTAAELAKELHASLTALHVVGVPNVVRKSQSLSAQALLDACRKRNSIKGVEPEIIIREGSPSEEIHEATGTMRWDLLVIGTHGRHGVPRAARERRRRRSPPHRDSGTRRAEGEVGLSFAGVLSKECTNQHRLLGHRYSDALETGTDHKMLAEPRWSRGPRVLCEPRKWRNSPLEPERSDANPGPSHRPAGKTRGQRANARLF